MSIFTKGLQKGNKKETKHHLKKEDLELDDHVVVESLVKKEEKKRG